MKNNQDNSYWMMVWKQYNKHWLGRIALWIVILFCLVGIYAPFLASSKPFIVQYDGEWYFPLFRYLFYRGFFTKRLDIFFNLLMFTLPLAVLCFYLWGRYPKRLMLSLFTVLILHTLVFSYYAYAPANDPEYDSALSKERQVALKNHPLPNWNFDLQYMSPYAKLNQVLRFQQRKDQNAQLKHYNSTLKNPATLLPTLWNMQKKNDEREIARQESAIKFYEKGSDSYNYAEASIRYIRDREQWLEQQSTHIKYNFMPLIRPFHWEDDAGGSQILNRYVNFWNLSRINGKDLVAALIFGVRVSIVVGILAVFIALVIGIPIGAFAGYYGGTFDIIVSRLLEIWESMPTFFMLLMVVAMMQSKSIFLVIAVIGLFGWTGFSRYLRGEFFKQRNLPYIEACRAIGLSDGKIIFSHIMPNATPPILTLLPFAIMAAITSEAGLSFLGLGEEGSCSWGVLMDEGRSAFPSQSYLLWPPAILLTVLLVAIAIVGDTLRDAIDPKLQR